MEGYSLDRVVYVGLRQGVNGRLKFRQSGVCRSETGSKWKVIV